MFGKRRRSAKFKVPFLKFKINKRTWSNILGFIIVGFGLVLFLSYIQQGSVLQSIYNALTFRFGILSLLFPLIIVLFGSHFFNQKKLRIIKPNISLGLLLIFIALLGVVRSGQIGVLIIDNLRLDFSAAGALLILFLTFIIGLILFLNTSVDVFLLYVVHGMKATFMLVKRLITLSKVRKDQANKADNGDFIKDQKVKINEKTYTPPVAALNQNALGQNQNPQDGQLHIRTLPKEVAGGPWEFPPISLLSDIAQGAADKGDIRKNSDIIERTLDSFGVGAQVSEVNAGPTVTQYALEIKRGVKLSKITALSNDLALALAATTGQVRIEAPIPGRSLVGMEIPNKKAEIVTMKRMLASPTMTQNHDPLLVPLGLDVSGEPIATSISRMPHVLIAGTTGAGKSILLNAWICSFLFRAKPEDLRLILVDPKRVELSVYNGIPHLLTEVIVEPEKIISALKWTVGEMETRYKKFATLGAKNLETYNNLPNIEKLPYIVFVIDELADLMIFAPRDAEEQITRIAQMARATGIHLILATQRPSVDVITGLMKANIPTRIAFNVASMIDSRVVLDMPGAEKLLGKGDMLFLPPDQAKPRRIQGPFLADKDVHELVAFLKKKIPVVHYTEEVTNQEVGLTRGAGGRMGGTGSASDRDPFFNQAVEIVTQFGKASASLLQRRLSVGYARAAKILDQLEIEGYIGPAEGSKPRPVIQRRQETTPQQDTQEV